MSLNPPTPLQWKTLQECVVVHRNDRAKPEGEGGIEDHLSEGTTATIEAAPIVAFIDETTGVS